MGCDTNGVIEGDFNGRVFEVVKRLIAGVNASCTCKHNIWPDRTIASGIYAETMFANADGMLQMHFKDGDNHRSMSIFFRCWHDYQELIKAGAPRLIISLGMSGNASKIIKSCLDQFDERCWFIENDCGDYNKENSLYHAVRKKVPLTPEPKF